MGISPGALDLARASIASPFATSVLANEFAKSHQVTSVTDEANNSEENPEKKRED
jgi:hypothetical protein